MAEASGSTASQKSHKIAAILQAVSDYDLTNSHAWSDLDALSSRTSIDAIEVDPEGIILSNAGFKGVMNVYVVLRYGGSSKDAFETSDAFRARFDGHFDGELAVIDNVQVDTSPFYDGERA
jgi:hypothetical protein